MTLNDPYPGFKVTLFFDAEYLRNGTRYRHSFIGILIGTYIRPTVSFRMTLSDLAKYSMKRSIARPLCDSRATCYDTRRNDSLLPTRQWIQNIFWAIRQTSGSESGLIRKFGFCPWLFFRSLGTCSLWRYGSCISATDSHAFCKQKKRKARVTPTKMKVKMKDMWKSTVGRNKV